MEDTSEIQSKAINPKTHFAALFGWEPEELFQLPPLAGGKGEEESACNLYLFV